MVPQHRRGRIALALLLSTLAVIVAGAALVLFTGPASQSDDTLNLAPMPTDLPTAVVAAVATQVADVPATPTPAPARVKTNTSEFERVLQPLLALAKQHRLASAAEDPTYWTRLDPKLNSTRLNILLFGYGETHEPPVTERAFIGSITIFSYDYANHSIDLISLTHDIRAPEIERYLHDQGQQQVGPIKIDRAYSFGGFDLMRKTLEDATGLAIDYQLAFKETAIQHATDEVFSGLDVDVPQAFKVNAYYLDDVKYPAGEFQAGVQHLDGQQVIQFIKTVPVEEHYSPLLEHNARKHLVFRSIMETMAQHSGDVAFLGRAALFFSSQVAHDSIAYDFDLPSLIVGNLRSMMTDLGHADSTNDSTPEVNRTMYVVDPASGDGGVQWVQANAHDNPITQRDIDNHVYPELAMEIPYTGNPYAPDLVSGYWTSVRQLISQHLTD